MSPVDDLETQIAKIPGLEALWAETKGDPEIRIAVLDGPVDYAHPCFGGSRLSRLQTLTTDEVDDGRMAAHGTHVTSVVFGQHGGPVDGLAPSCHGLIAQVFRDKHSARLSQLDLARAIEQSVQEGAHIINISGGERSPTGEPDALLQKALRLCEENGVLVVAAAGNDGCECLHVPAACGSVLAVGATNKEGQPLAVSNWGERYSRNGVLAPGQNIRGAVPGGGTALRTGTSFAAPIVSGVAGLLLSIQRLDGSNLDPRAIGTAIIESALPCSVAQTSDYRRCLAGVLNIPGAYAHIKKTSRRAQLVTTSTTSVESTPEGQVSACHPKGLSETGSNNTVPAAESPSPEAPAGETNSSLPVAVEPSATTPSSTCICIGGEAARKKSYVFAIGTIGYDFGTEARRDSFRQLMPMVNRRPANPYATEQMVSYLEANAPEAAKLIWTFNLELTPVYAIEPEVPYAREVYEFLRKALSGQVEEESSRNYISRVSLPGVLSGNSVRLFSGQIVPIVVAQHRGLWSWNVNALVDSVVALLKSGKQEKDPREEALKISLRNFLDKVYYELRNLGQSSPDRALNYSATNAFQATEVMARSLHPKELIPAAGFYMLDGITVSKSPFCRLDSDCWDVKLTFFDPENERRARVVMRFTVDVSDEMPVTMGPVRHWSESSNSPNR